VNNNDERDFAEEKANREILETGDGEVAMAIHADDVIHEESRRFQITQEHVSRYLKARYGDDVVYRAPETFENAIERWMIYSTTHGAAGLAEQTMQLIEEKVKA
jgi:hypothetical protein